MSDCELGHDSIGSDVVDWLYVKDSFKDLRMFYLNCVVDSVTGEKRFKTKDYFGECKVHQISMFTHKPVCFTT